MFTLVFLSLIVLQVQSDSKIGRSLDEKLNTIEANYTTLQAKYQQLQKDVANIKSFLHLSCAPCLSRSGGNDGMVHRECDCTNLQPKQDCLEFYESSIRFDGLYRLTTEKGNPVTVYCDQTTDGGGWTVFQRRIDGSVDFYRNWTEYRNGFGDVAKEHWLGNENIHRLTLQKSTTLLINMKIKTNVVTSAWAKYSSFYIDGESEKYKLHISGYTGTIRDDRLSYNNGGKFCTKDEDNDDVKYKNCAQENYYGKGAWWMKGCTYVTLNGVFGNMKWIVSNSPTVTFSEMKIRRNQ